MSFIWEFNLYAVMISNEFKPSVFHPYYFIRKGLIGKIQQYSPLLRGRLLDFGCGSKPYKALINNVDEYIGVDYENEGHPHVNEQIDIFYDGKNIPVASDYFDAGLTSEVFEHVFNLEEVLKELHRVLKPGAPLLVTCPFVWKEHEVPNDFARYTHFALRHTLEKNGFRIRTLDKSGNFIEVMFQLRVLYFFDNWYPKLRRIPLIGALSKLLFIAIPNIAGNFLSKILPVSRTMYLNNIVVAEKAV
jgi:SAM-dependent methyltransferase